MAVLLAGGPLGALLRPLHLLRSNIAEPGCILLAGGLAQARARAADLERERDLAAQRSAGLEREREAAVQQREALERERDAAIAERK